MHDPGIRQLASAAGLSLCWTDYRGREHVVTDETLEPVLQSLGVGCANAQAREQSFAMLRDEALQSNAPLITAIAGQPIALSQGERGRYLITLESGATLEGHRDAHTALPPIEEQGYHRLQIGNAEPVTLAVAPPQVFGMSDLGGERRRWGLTAQVYSLRREGDGGIGDLGGVAALARSAAAQGADALAISPIHALFGAYPDHFGPYSPSSRLMRNPVLADPTATFGAQQVAAALAQSALAERFADCERQAVIDPQAAVQAKMELLRQLHARLSGTSLHDEFRAYCEAADTALRGHACFEVLHRQLLDASPGYAHWRNWPQEFRDPAGSAVSAFARKHPRRIEFQMFLQWLTERSLAQAQRTALQSGMRIGLIGDLAIGTDGAGSHAWSRQTEMLIGLRIGAPPDPLNVKGQDWGLSALSPRAMKRYGFGAFIELLRASFRHVGGIRLDHVFGLQRLWMIPDGMTADRGVYVEYPFTDLLRLIALESWRHRAIVIGEDLGTMPEGFQQRMTDAGIPGMRVLWFQRDHGLFVSPAQWPKTSVAMTTTHDLPTVAGWWQGTDIGWRTRLDLLEPGTDETSLRVERERERMVLWDAFAHAGVAGGPLPGCGQGGDAVHASAAFIGSTPSQLALLPVEDALALAEQPNIPGTVDGHPNWLRRLPDPAASCLDADDVRARLATLHQQRGASR